MAVKKFTFGKPLDTGAVVRPVPAAEGLPEIGAVTLEGGFRYELALEPGRAVYGLGEALGGLDKRGRKYVSYNLDQDFHATGVTSLYGAHNFVLVEGERPVGLFFDCPGRLEWDIGFTRQDVMTVTAAYPDLDLYIIEAETLTETVRLFRKLIGRSWIPPRWAMGFGQSRFGYKTPEDFLSVANGYRAAGIPLDALYMDIDYMDRYKDFTVNPETFPDFPAFVAQMRQRGVRLVPIIDAAVKAEPGWQVCDQGLEHGYFCTGEDGEPFETAAWPGVTYLPDVLNSEARRWFGDWYRVLTEAGIEGFWNDMNEPSIFYTRQSMTELKAKLGEFLTTKEQGIELFKFHYAISRLAGPDNYRLFYHDMDGVRVNHDRVHNLYGYNMTRAASEAFDRMYPDKRLLLFARSSTIGAHRYGGVWTGDNASRWEDLQLNVWQMPALNMCGFLYAGADIGGFGGDVSRDLLLRWLAFGVFTPLMRNHTAIFTRDQECFRFERPEDFAQVIGVRYRLLPYLYSELVKAALTDGLYFRPLAFDYPSDPLARAVTDQLMLGEGLMVAPVVTPNAQGRWVYLPEDMLLVKFTPAGILQEKLSQGAHYIPVALNEVPVFVKKNRILPVAQPAMRAEEVDDTDLALTGWLDAPAEYTLYTDDGFTKDYGAPSHLHTLRLAPEA